MIYIYMITLSSYQFFFVRYHYYSRRFDRILHNIKVDYQMDPHHAGPKIGIFAHDLIVIQKS